MTYDVENIQVTKGQKDLAAYIKKETGKSIKPESIALVDALRIAYRKDPARVAEREAMKKAAEAKQREALDKALEKARRLAERLGVAVPDLDVSTTEPEDPAEEFMAQDHDDEDYEPDVEFSEAPAPKAKKPASRKTSTGRKIEAVPAADQSPANATITSPDIEVMEEEDGFETSADDDFEDDEFAGEDF